MSGLAGTVSVATVDVLVEVGHERERQDVKWGEQNHPNGTGPALRFVLAAAGYLHGIAADELREWAVGRTDQKATEGALTYEQILTEEWAEAIACDDPAALRAELLQVAAVAVAWVEKIDRDAR